MTNTNTTQTEQALNAYNEAGRELKRINKIASKAGEALNEWAGKQDRGTRGPTPAEEAEYRLLSGACAIASRASDEARRAKTRAHGEYLRLRFAS